MGNQPTKASDPLVFTIAPSDLTFLLDECRRCFYLKVVLGHRRPARPMPGVFTIFDRQQRAFFEGKRTSELHESLPPGLVRCSGLTVRSAPIPIPNRKVAIVFKGALDSVLAFSNGNYGIADFKTTEPKSHLPAFYSPQLHAYAIAVENPAAGREPISPVRLLGLLCFEPNTMLRLPDGALAYRTTPTWMPIQRDDKGFFDLLTMVGEMLEGSTPPKGASSCPWCGVDSPNIAPRRAQASRREIASFDIHTSPPLFGLRGSG